MNNSDIYLFSSLSFSVFSLSYATFIFYLYSFFFIAPVEGLCCKPKYRTNIIHHVIFVLFFFFYHSSSRKDQFTVLSLNFGTQDFTDPGLPKIGRTLTGLSLLFGLIQLIGSTRPKFDV